LSGLRSCVDFFSVCQQRNRSASSNGVEQPDAEAAAQRVEQQTDLADRQAAASQVGQHRQLEQVHRRIAALGEAARFGAMGATDAGELARVPPQLPRGEPVIDATSREL
jgi:hypothetical protein